MLEAGPPLADPDVASMVTDVSVLPLGTASPLVRRYQTMLTERPHRMTRVVRGAVVGGSGTVNGGYFCRGLRRDFDGWGLPGWSWDEVLAHFRAIENDHDFSGPAHSQGGPIPIRRVSELSRTTTDFVDCARQAGYRWIPDLNSTDELAGIGPVPLNIADGGVRAGPGTAILLPALSRPNLALQPRTRVRRLTLRGSRVTGVEAVGAQGVFQLTADRIVLCAGAIESARLLMASGIGDETVLRRAGIAVVMDSPVGRQCVDHPEWVIRTSWITTPGRPLVEAILCTEFDIEIRPYTGGFVAMIGGHAGSTKGPDGTAGHPDWPHIGVALMRPRSRGRVTVVSADPGVPPRVEHRYDTEPADVAALRRGAELVRDLCSRSTTLGEPLWSTSQHLCSTAPMGTDDDERAVLDPQCRVRGVDGLWVIDGSALPTTTGRGPHATIVMLAHRAAEFVAAE